MEIALRSTVAERALSGVLILTALDRERGISAREERSELG